MLNFTEAIYEIEKGSEQETPPPITDAKLADALRKLYEQDPDFWSMFKDMTASDVHVSTALGNAGDKSKPLSFAEAVEALTGQKPDKVEEVDDEATTTAKRNTVDEDVGIVHDDEVSFPLIINKIEPEQRKIYGWASVSQIKGKLVVDKQDDIIEPAELLKAAENFVLNSRVMGDMHEKKFVGRLFMSYVTTPEINKIFGIAVKDDVIGWMVGFKIDNDELWHAMKSGERPEFSIGGRGQRVEI